MKSANRVALKEWSVVIRFLHEGGVGLIFIEDGFFLFPTYDRQRSGALKPSAGMVYQHELRRPKTGGVYLREIRRR